MNTNNVMTTLENDEPHRKSAMELSPLACQNKAGTVWTQVRASFIQNETNLEALRKLLRGRLEVFAQKVDAHVSAERVRIDVELQERLAELKSRHLENLQVKEIAMIERQMNMLFDLNNRRQQIEQEARAKNWSPEILEKTLGTLDRLFQKTFQEIELGRPQSDLPPEN